MHQFARAPSTCSRVLHLCSWAFQRNRFFLTKTLSKTQRPTWVTFIRLRDQMCSQAMPIMREVFSQICRPTPSSGLSVARLTELPPKLNLLSEQSTSARSMTHRVTGESAQERLCKESRSTIAASTTEIASSNRPWTSTVVRSWKSR